jgi:hypothetical protein
VNYARTLGDQSRRSLIFWPDDTGKMKLIRELRQGTAEPIADDDGVPPG